MTHIGKKWIDALRSDKYLQGTGALHSVTPKGTHRFCCLGVYCDIRDPSAWRLDEDTVISDDCAAYEYHGRWAVLTDELGAEAGLTDSEQSTLVEMNDRGETFEVIASHLEELYKEKGFIEHIYEEKGLTV